MSLKSILMTAAGAAAAIFVVNKFSISLIKG